MSDPTSTLSPDLTQFISQFSGQTEITSVAEAEFLYRKANAALPKARAVVKCSQWLVRWHRLQMDISLAGFHPVAGSYLVAGAVTLLLLVLAWLTGLLSATSVLLVLAIGVAAGTLLARAMNEPGSNWVTATEAEMTLANTRFKTARQALKQASDRLAKIQAIRAGVLKAHAEYGQQKQQRHS
ncbi:MAG: hypothetical protein IT448_06490 [Phycisphaerales bacterium]|nr:hypothetical protein [Phycisphaerales bacterium]